MDILWTLVLVLVLGYIANLLLGLFGDWVTERKIRREMDEMNREHKEGDR